MPIAVAFATLFLLMQGGATNPEAPSLEVSMVAIGNQQIVLNCSVGCMFLSVLFTNGSRIIRHEPPLILMDMPVNECTESGGEGKQVYTLTINGITSQLFNTHPELSCFGLTDQNDHISSNVIVLNNLYDLVLGTLQLPQITIADTGSSSSVWHCTLSCSYLKAEWNQGNTSYNPIRRANFSDSLTFNVNNLNCLEPSENKLQVHKLVINNPNITTILPIITCVGTLPVGEGSFYHAFSSPVHLSSDLNRQATGVMTAVSTEEPTTIRAETTANSSLGTSCCSLSSFVISILSLIVVFIIR